MLACLLAPRRLASPQSLSCAIQHVYSLDFTTAQAVAASLFLWTFSYLRSGFHSLASPTGSYCQSVALWLRHLNQPFSLLVACTRPSYKPMAKKSRPPKPAKQASSRGGLLYAAAAAVVAIAVALYYMHRGEEKPVAMERPPPVKKDRTPPSEEATNKAPAPGVPVPNPACEDKAPECKDWAKIGECDANPGYMLVHCASSCDKCDMLDYRKRCAVDETLPLSVPPGDMGKTFRRASSQEFAALDPVVLSSDPWVLQFDNFLSDEEADAFIRGGRTKGWVLSEDAGAMRSDGSFEAIRSSHRTSMTAWCDTAAWYPGVELKPLTRR